MNRRTRLALGGVVLAVVVLGVLFTSPDAVLARLSWLAANPLRFATVLLAVAVVRPFLAWPTTLLAVAAGYGFGLAVGLPFALLLMTVTALPPFLLARRARGTGRMTVASERFVDRTGDFRSVAASRFLPAPSDVVSVAAGVANVSVFPFLAGTAVGELPWAVAGVLLGSSLDVVSADSLSAVVDARLLVAVALVGLLGLAGPVYRYVAGDNAAGDASGGRL
ncbi:Uncharacterized membrane protein YdjX, TVP38/TMEM64 family, SNARE-associated domain [Halogranum amylolyticum]|uniref:Uncharacterized membrane protein YdjX, TVP38/TMEM64 family, SNARE-associated domain n=1 Tax=Halogranum amylolyticum TaxID=660520 RepID=A0A1H8RI76_9EURY|nr:VTT domain-containing protein [Halogranum amylolyticum]SEO66110.1 Uncharacterized membrane protein YdjX, TVP38/TMEM64 family, SNARE-associated domain [Halogranum amylolyticum]